MANTAAARDFTAQPAVRREQPLLLGISGPPGSGKTLSAVKIAYGIQQDRGGDIIFLDTDGDRGLQYAAAPGQKPDFIETFNFDHFSFNAPYSPHDFLAAIRAQLLRKPAAIIVDSMSSEHEDEGGVLEWHDAELDRMAGNDWAKRERVGQAAWKAPKGARREMINALLKIKTPIIFCFRAREKVKQLPNDKGKLVPTNIGWTPIAPPEIVGSMTLFCLLPIKSDGVPMWKGATHYEDFSIKLPAQFRAFIQDGAALNPNMGRAMSEWARGVPVTGFVHPAGTTTPQQMRPPSEPPAPENLEPAAREAAAKGGAALDAYLLTLTKTQKHRLGGIGADLRATARAVDDGRVETAETAETPPETPAEPATPAPVYILRTATGSHQTFEAEGDFLIAYESDAATLYAAGKASALLQFDQANNPLIAKHPGLAAIIKQINQRIRRPAGTLNI